MVASVPPIIRHLIGQCPHERDTEAADFSLVHCQRRVRRGHEERIERTGGVGHPGHHLLIVPPHRQFNGARHVFQPVVDDVGQDLVECGHHVGP